MEPRIEYLSGKTLVGKRIRMSFSDNRTYELWRSFMPKRNEIKNRTNSDLISMQVYDKLPDFVNFNPTIKFDKWAAAEVSDFDSIPEEMETFVLVDGLYAVFDYKGSSNEAQEVFKYIFGIWLPDSDYVLDDRPHFEILGEKYKNNNPESEEEIWIPIKPITNSSPLND
jgi:AraC family transcriptional regulator